MPEHHCIHVHVHVTDYLYVGGFISVAKYKNTSTWYTCTEVYNSLLLAHLGLRYLKSPYVQEVHVQCPTPYFIHVPVFTLFPSTPHIAHSRVVSTHTCTVHVHIPLSSQPTCTCTCTHQ